MYNIAWVIVAVVAIGGSYFIRYQKMKMNKLKKGTHQDLEDMQTMIDSLKKRIENLEAIASEPESKGLESSAPEVKRDNSGAQPGKMENMLK